MSEAILEIRGLNKYFGPTHANVDVDFTLKKGEVHGLIGENGSGKSTLLSQIAGLYGSDSGEMKVNGQPYKPHSPLDAYDHKISMVMQELGVVGSLPAGINVFLGRMNRFSKAGILNKKALYKEVAEILNNWDLAAPPLNRNTNGMSIESRKMIELARALSVDPEILLLDEVTQSLSLNNRERLYKLIEKFKAMGRSVIVITHDIEEMIEITDNITVLRDGAVVGTVASAETTPDEIRNMMVGREVEGGYYRDDFAPDYSDKVELEVRNLTVAGEIEDVSFDVHEGEILGFCGLSDSGIHTVGQAVYGLTDKKLTSGTVHLMHNDTYVKNATTALRNNVGYVPKDRDNEALMIAANIRDNFGLPSIHVIRNKGTGFISPAKVKKLSNDMVDKLSVKTTGIYQSMDSLSGGNKQKVNLGRWLAKDIKLLILDCPTRGVDVGVKAYIYSIMKEAKKDNIAMILISDELTEVLGMSDRIIVMKDGKVSGEMDRSEDLTEQKVIGVMI